MELVPVGALLPADSPRSAGEDPHHTQLLAQSGAVLPPITVHRGSMRVVDGMHRLRATVARGEDLIRVRFFEGTACEAFLLAVRENTAHGLPLSLSDRAAAASRIIRSHGTWADRAIAETTGLSARTVREIRRVTLDEADQPAVRLGRDGRTRPLNSARGRVLAGRLIAEMPTASLRQIAELAGISPGTVRDVRARIDRGEDPVPPSMTGSTRRSSGADSSSAPHAAERDAHRGPAGRAEREPEREPGREHPPIAEQRQVGEQRPPAEQPPAAEPARDQGALLALLAKDPSLKYAENGRLLLRLLSATSLPPQYWRELMNAVPGHSLPLVSQAARACAETWAEFADRLDGRT
ncbi:hypothetical protein [Kitasatospora sp. NPDC057541]|uniref:hypothetical protein n=1 Tax=unclassified Kitasatospora TaxID=2633591 RepID=UPI0036889FA8